MKNNLKNLWIALAVVVVLGGAMTALLLLPSDGGGPLPEPASGAGDSSSVKILEGDVGEMVSMTVENPNGRYTFIPDANKISGFTIEGLEEQDLQDQFVQYATADSCRLEAVRDFGERGNLAEYGLDDPVAAYTVSFKNGMEKTVHIGDAVPGETGLYYVALSDSRRVYSTAIYELLLGTSLDYINTTLVTVPAEESKEQSDPDSEANFDILPDQIRIGGALWAEEVLINQNENYQRKGYPLSDVPMVMRQPIDAACVGEGWDALWDQLKNVSASRAVSVDISAKSLQRYGLDRPGATIQYMLGENKISLLVGDKTQAETEEGTETRYIMAEGGRAIFEIAQSSVSGWTDGDFYKFTGSRTYRLEDIKRIEVDVEGVSYTFTYEVAEGEAEGENAEEGKATSDGLPLTLTNFEKYFAFFSAIQSEGMPDQPVSGQPELTVTLYYRSNLPGNPSTIRFYPAGNRRYNVVYDDEDCYMVVRESFVNNLKENTKKCARNLEVKG